MPAVPEPELYIELLLVSPAGPPVRRIGERLVSYARDEATKRHVSLLRGRLLGGRPYARCVVRGPRASCCTETFESAGGWRGQVFAPWPSETTTARGYSRSQMAAKWRSSRSLLTHARLPPSVAERVGAGHPRFHAGGGSGRGPTGAMICRVIDVVGLIELQRERL